MTYNEWRDELKSNLLSVSESERRRVLDYYAEAYADRRDAGFTEYEIINDFGAPYDAAQRILAESDPAYGSFDEPINPQKPENGAYCGGNGNPPREKRQEKRHGGDRRTTGYENGTGEKGKDEYFGQTPYTAPPPQPAPQPEQQKSDRLPVWAIILLCILLAAPAFGVFMTLVGLTIGLFAAPVGMIGGGVSCAVAGIVGICHGYFTFGLVRIGAGLLLVGFGLMLLPLFIKLLKLLWELAKKIFAAVKSLLGRRTV